jgi:hypothetical protein
MGLSEDRLQDDDGDDDDDDDDDDDTGLAGRVVCMGKQEIHTFF